MYLYEVKMLNDLIEKIKRIYFDNNKEKTWDHVESVAKTAVRLAEIYNLDTEKIRLSALLHDISAIISPQKMYDMAVERGMEIDPAEEKYKFILHQRISKIMAHDDFGIVDEDVLDAIECHTTLKRNACAYDKVIFIADKISWDQSGVPPYYDVVVSEADKSLDKACYNFIKYQFDNNLLLMPHKWIIEAYDDLKSKIK
jgi:predicted HD superfamily hydrolase involved in NAD metabolism